tara:strand:- start:2139 stop:2396 length:258 start_codon:yes stop_codon:yes gene_type:complete
MKAKVTITESFYGEDWGDGSQLSGETITLQGEGYKMSYNIKEGDSEDMIFGRNLEGVGNIEQMIIKAHELGKQGVELEFAYVEEK